MSGAVFDVDTCEAELPAPQTPPTPQACHGVEPSDLDDPFVKERAAERKRAAKQLAVNAHAIHGRVFDLTSPPKKHRKTEGSDSD